MAKNPKNPRTCFVRKAAESNIKLKLPAEDSKPRRGDSNCPHFSLRAGIEWWDAVNDILIVARHNLMRGRFIILGPLYSLANNSRFFPITTSSLGPRGCKIKVRNSAKALLLLIGYLTSQASMAAGDIKRGCVATADVFAKEDTIRVSNQGTSSTPENEANVAFIIITQSGGTRGKPVIISLSKKSALSITIEDIYRKAGATWPFSSTPDLIEVIETDSNLITHELQAVILYTATRQFPNPNRATPLIFTCSHELSVPGK